MTINTYTDKTKIHEYVTHPSLPPEEAVKTDEHGVYPINPLGFPDTDFCSTDPDCEAAANPPFPQSKEFRVEMDYALPVIPAVDVEIPFNVKLDGGPDAKADVLKLETVSFDDKTYSIEAMGDLTALLETVHNAFSLANACYEDYSVTNLLAPEGGEPITHVATEVTYDAIANVTRIAFSCSDCTISGRVGEKRLLLVVTLESGKYVLLTAQNLPAENGLYMVTEDNWPRLASVERVKGSTLSPDDSDDPYNHASSLDNVSECDHFRHGYSDKEVADEVSLRCSNIIDNSIHPSAVAGDLSGAGLMTHWFVECGNIDFGGSSTGGDHVIVDGFGLGGIYSGECHVGNGCPREHVKATDSAPTLSPILNMSIGTNMSDSGDKLAKDWPFTAASSHISADLDNNITLVKKMITLQGGSQVGGLVRDIMKTCPDCNGTGEVDGNKCHTCDGKGELLVAHQDIKRVNLCINNDFSSNVLKKTYVHLPATLDTKDGDEIELTVSLPTINTDDAYSGSDIENLSAHYEYMSQPRVLVISGYWKFSETGNSWIMDSESNPYENDGVMTITGDKIVPFVDKDGEPVADGTKVRFTLDGGKNCPRYSDIIGTLETNEAGNIVISGVEGFPYTNRHRDTHMRICGLAYLDPASDEENNVSEESLGLHSRNDVTLGTAEGDGSADTLSEFNKFISVTEEEDRKVITGEGDARQVIATVYPTASNTFQWKAVGRNKLRSLDKLMTDEWDIGAKSVSSMIWDANKKLIDTQEVNAFFGYGENNYGFTADTMPLRYSKDNGGDGISRIGAQLRVSLSSDGSQNSSVSEQPVRQARKAVKMLNLDFAKMRMYRGANLPRVNTNSNKLRYTDTAIESSLDSSYSSWWADADTTTATEAVKDNEFSSAAWKIKARHLPDYLRLSGQDTTIAGNSAIGINPFIDDNTKSRYSQNLYGTTEFGTSNATSVVPCDNVLHGENEAFGYRSVISARVESDPDAVANELYRDANRVSELQTTSIDKWTTGIQFDPQHPYNNLLGNSANTEKWSDVYSATSNIFSIDTIPHPDDMVLRDVDLTEEQLPMIGGDAFATYALKSELDDPEFVATNLPFYDMEEPKSIALTNLLRDFVYAFGAKMPVRWWDSTRVAMPPSGTIDNHVKLPRLTWPEAECEMSPELRASIVDDEFISRSSGKALDCNLNRVFLDRNGDVYIDNNWSASPIKVNRSWYDRFEVSDQKFAGPTGYVRVFMKFKFSKQAGRWYTVDYRQAPMSYLTPLYGAKALEERIGGTKLWAESICPPFMGWKDALMHPYYKYVPMDFNTEAIRSLIDGFGTVSDFEQENNTDLKTSQVSMPRLKKPYLPVSEGGLGLSASVDVHGNPKSDLTSLASDVHVNFWSVRKHLRPAVSAMPGTDVPAFGYDDGEPVYVHQGGVMGDSVLWGQFDFPRKDETSYTMPPVDVVPAEP